MDPDGLPYPHITCHMAMALGINDSTRSEEPVVAFLQEMYEKEAWQPRFPKVPLMTAPCGVFEGDVGFDRN